jgi:hypothetical protein
MPSALRSDALTLAAACLWLASCGGGEPTAPVAPPVSTAYEKSVAQHAYAGTPRTPADFYADPPPAGVTGMVATTHLKNADVAAPANGTRYELCTDDMAQAIAWSEVLPTFNGSYADIVDVAANAQTIEVLRVPRSDVNARLRHRVFRCSYVDRSTTNLDSISGSAGVVNVRPLTAASLKALAEYLWQFTVHNNADHVVLSSVAGSAPAGQIAHVIEMARLTRATVSGQCDQIDVQQWTHTADATAGTLQRALATTRTLRARRDTFGEVTICP